MYVRHFGMVKPTGIGNRVRGHLQRLDLSAGFYENLPIYSKVFSRRITDRHHGDRINLTLVCFKQSKL
jgi:hypothetical protein